MDTASIRRVAKEMRERKVNHSKHTSPTLVAWADQLEVAAADSLEQPAASPSAVHTALRMLIAAGFVTQAKANEALRIATGFMSGPLEAQPASAPMSPAIAPPFKVARDKLDFSYGDVYVSRPYYRDATIEERKAIIQMPVPPAPTSAEPVSIAGLLNHEQLSAFASSCGYSNDEAFFTLELLDAAIAGAPPPASCNPTTPPASAEPVVSPVSGCVHHDFSTLDRYIRDIRWSGDTPADIRDAVTSNLRGLYGHLLCRGMFAGAGSWDAGRMAAAKWVENRRCAYGDEYGEADPTTGVLEFGNGYPERDEYYSELAEIEEAIRALPSPQFIAHAPPASCNPTTQPASVPDGAVDVRRPSCTSSEPCPACAAAQPAKPADAVPLARYGFTYGIQDAATPQPMNDGYWTPWHVADLVIAGLREERDAREAAAGGVPAGYVIVPRALPIEAEIAFCEAWFSRTRVIDNPEMQDAWSAALGAIPQQPAAEPAVEATGTVDGYSWSGQTVDIILDGAVPRWMIGDKICVTISPTGGKPDA